MRRIPPVLLALVLGLLAAFAVACGDGGDEKLLGPNTADNIRTALNDVRDRIEEGECGDRLDRDLDQLGEAVRAVPSSVDRDLRRRLGDGVQHLRNIAPGDCAENKPETTETQPETTETLPPETTETLPPATTETVPPPPTTTQEPPQTTPVPPETTPDEPVLPEDPTGGTPGAGVPPGQAKKGDKG
ncbi:MAG TPA: hypothetical protein VF587_00965 [Solirubrobacteraceae bacterium]